MVRLHLDSRFLHVVAVVAEGRLAYVASRVAERMASTKEAGYLRRVVSGIAAATAAPEAAVALDTGVGVARAVGTEQLDAGYGIVALPDYPGSIRQKPSPLISCTRSVFEIGARCW